MVFLVPFVLFKILLIVSLLRPVTLRMVFHAMFSSTIFFTKRDSTSPTCWKPFPIAR